MPDFGVSSETLAELKQNIYVAGIGGQIDSGAWERLEPGKRLDGFDHVFLWTQGPHTVVGELWSSADRKGRAKYPMGAGIQLEDLPLESSFETVRLILEQVRDACRATTSADRVMLSCQAAQDQLNQWISGTAASPGTAAINSEDTRHFLRAEAFQPDSLGLLRVLHELDTAIGPQLARGAEARKTTDWQSYHVRVPLSAKSACEGLLLWTKFLRCSLPETVPLLLLVRNHTDWLDVVIGNPADGGLFCLQASTHALPLATAIPYDIAPALTARLKTITACFLGGPSDAAENARGLGERAAPVSGSEEGQAQTNHKTRSGTWVSLGLSLAAVGVLCLALVVWTRPKAAGARNATRGNDELAAERSAEVARQAAEREQRYSLAVQEARAAFARGDYSNALACAEAALAIRTNDVEVTKLEADVRAEQRFRSGLSLAQAAYDRGDYAEAIKQADLAAEVRSGDPALVSLKEAAARQLATRHADAQLQQKYLEAVNSARVALQEHDYPRALSQAEAALELKPSGAEATQIRLSARQEQAFAAATTAFEKGDYSGALSQCQPFQGTERFDSLRQQIGQEQSQLQRLQQALQTGNYQPVLTAVAPAKPEFQKLKTAAVEENQALEDAKQKLAKGDYSYVQTLSQASYGTKAPFAALLKTGRTESEALNALQRSKEAGDRASVRDGFARLSVELRSKTPFEELDKWAAQTVENPPATTLARTSEAPPSDKIARFENVLRKLEIQFGTKEPDPAIVEDGHPVLREAAISKAKRTEAYARVRYLRDYRSDGWLTDDRKARLEKLEDAIRNFKE